MDLYPLILEPIYLPKPWGGRSLTALNRTLPTSTASGNSPDPPVGESWELADLASTSASGAGGQSAESVVANGPLAGQSLHQLIDHFADQIIAPADLTAEGRFPLLLKYLDAADNLSVQVHPKPDHAAAHPEAHLKSEAWYIVTAAPGSVIYKGLHPHVTADDLRAAIADRSVADLLVKVPAHPGDCHYLPSGTVHALGAGIVVAEVQTPSDTTFRIHDWHRTDRELHIDQALAAFIPGVPDTRAFEPGHLVERPPVTAEVLVRCEHFIIEKLSAPAGAVIELAPDNRPHIWMILAGQGSFESGTDTLTTTAIAKGQTVLLPAQLPNARFELAAHTEWLHIALP